MTPGLKPFADLRSGRSADGPVIVAFLLARSMGEFVAESLFAASVKRSLEHAILCVYWRNDRPFKGPLLGLNGHITHNWGAQGGASMPLDAFDDASGKPVHVRDLDWFRHRCHRPDVVLTPSMMRGRWPDGVSAPARFHWREEHGARLDGDLAALGVDPNRWFCVLKDWDSNDPDDLIAGEDRTVSGYDIRIVEKIVRDAGGQVVRVGHAKLPDRAAIAGRIDLADAGCKPLLLARAIARARFYIELTPSGTAMLARASAVPCWSPSGFAGQPSVAELEKAIGALAMQADDHGGWRLPVVEQPHQPSNRIIWPLRAGPGFVG